MVAGDLDALERAALGRAERRASGEDRQGGHIVCEGLVRIFKAEGLECLMLGPSPLAGLGPSGFAESATFRWLLARLYASRAVNDRVFNVRGHADLKRRFRGREVQRYFAWRRGSPYLHFIAMLRLCKAF
jgi:lysylphosphatidylglycerol synthetase-like protein (DUF2156 family)